LGVLKNRWDKVAILHLLCTVSRIISEIGSLGDGSGNMSSEIVIVWGPLVNKITKENKLNILSHCWATDGVCIGFNFLKSLAKLFGYDQIHACETTKKSYQHF
jgi:hypothetical protein